MSLLPNVLNQEDWRVFQIISSYNYMWFRGDLIYAKLQRSSQNLLSAQGFIQEILPLTNNLFKLPPFFDAGLLFGSMCSDLISEIGFPPNVPTSENSTARSFLQGLENSILGEQNLSESFKISDNVTNQNFDLGALADAFSQLGALNLNNNDGSLYNQINVI